MFISRADEEEAASAGFQALAREHEGLVTQLSAARKKAADRAMLSQLVSELSLHNQALAPYLAAIATRARDFQKLPADPLSGHVVSRGRKTFTQRKDVSS
jgi:hypothetical protein